MPMYFILLSLNYIRIFRHPEYLQHVVNFIVKVYNWNKFSFNESLLLLFSPFSKNMSEISQYIKNLHCT